MAATQLTLDDLRDLLLECAGADDDVDLDGDIGDVSLEDLGYDSLGVLNTVSRVETRYSVKLGDDVITDAKTPRLLLARINEALAGQSA